MTHGAQTWSAAILSLALVIAAGCDDARGPATVERTAAAANTPVTTPPPPADSAADKNPAEAAAPATDAKSSAVAAAQSEPKSSPADAEATQNITFDTLKFPLEKNADYQRSLLTPAIESLDRRPVKLRGYILPSFQQSGLTQFVLVRDNRECCFGPGAALYDCVVVQMKPGKTTEFTVRPVAVEGTFELRDYKGPDGKCLAIYHLDGDAVGF